MVIIITGPTHTGKTLLAQKLLEKYKYPYLSIDHLKMGLIRRKNTTLTPYDDDELVDYLWNILKEIIKTAIENKQNLIIEGCYVPFNYESYFSKEYLDNIKYVCLIFSENYIKNSFNNIIKYESIIENRLYTEITIDSLIKENKETLENAKKYNVNYILIENDYNLDINI